MTKWHRLFKSACEWAGGSGTAARAGRPVAQQRLRLTVESLEERSLLSSTGLTGHYFDDQAMSHLALVRTDQQIDFHWGWGKTAAPSMPTNHFSANWTGYLQVPESQTYTLWTRSDDGVRLLLDGRTIIDDWNDHSVREDSATLRLEAGRKYQIELDYYQNQGSADIQLGWSSPSLTKQSIPTDYLSTDGGPITKDLIPPTATVNAADVNTGGGTDYTFTVTYQDNVAIEISGLRSTNIVVTGPNYYRQQAALVSVDSSGNGTPRTATYRVSAPAGVWGPDANGTYTITLLPYEVKDTSGNSVPGGVLGTFRVAAGSSTWSSSSSTTTNTNNTSADWFSTHLSDWRITNLARQLDADGNLSRQDMIALFREVESSGVSSQRLADLRALIANGADLGMPESVRNLASKIVDGDPANTHFQQQWLGNIAPGSSGWQLENLVGKWFLGLDHPSTVRDVHYERAAGTLFGNGPVASDLHQGHLGDCYFLAALGELASQTPSALQSAITDNGDETYTVRFFHNGVPDYVTVDRMVPTDNQGSYWYEGSYRSVSDPSTKLWPILLEKAYAELAESGWSRPGQGSNSYGAIDGGWEGYVVNQLTGRSVSYQPITGSDDATRTAIVSAFQTSGLVGLDTRQSTSTGLTPNHAYALTGYDAQSGVFTLFNPYGFTERASWQQIATDFQGWSRVTS